MNQGIDQEHGTWMHTYCGELTSHIRIGIAALPDVGWPGCQTAAGRVQRQQLAAAEAPRVRPTANERTKSRKRTDERRRHKRISENDEISGRAFRLAAMTLRYRCLAI